MDYITSHHGEGYQLKAITDLSITPRLHSDDACCQMALDNSVFVVQEYVYWLEILMVINITMRLLAGNTYGNYPNVTSIGWKYVW